MPPTVGGGNDEEERGCKRLRARALAKIAGVAVVVARRVAVRVARWVVVSDAAAVGKDEVLGKEPLLVTPAGDAVAEDLREVALEFSEELQGKR